MAEHNLALEHLRIVPAQPLDYYSMGRMSQLSFHRKSTLRRTMGKNRLACPPYLRPNPHSDQNRPTQSHLLQLMRPLYFLLLLLQMCIRDRYTSAQFYTRLKKHHMKQSMSRVAHCIDNGPMEGFWGILKREMYYKQRFNDRSSLITAIANYIDYYNNQRLQRKLHVMTPMKYHEQYTKAA